MSELKIKDLGNIAPPSPQKALRASEQVDYWMHTYRVGLKIGEQEGALIALQLAQQWRDRYAVCHRAIMSMGQI